MLEVWGLGVGLYWLHTLAAGMAESTPSGATHPPCHRHHWHCGWSPVGPTDLSEKRYLFAFLGVAIPHDSQGCWQAMFEWLNIGQGNQIAIMILSKGECTVNEAGGDIVMYLSCYHLEIVYKVVETGVSMI